MVALGLCRYVHLVQQDAFQLRGIALRAYCSVQPYLPSLYMIKVIVNSFTMSCPGSTCGAPRPCSI